MSRERSRPAPLKASALLTALSLLGGMFAAAEMTGEVIRRVDALTIFATGAGAGAGLAAFVATLAAKRRGH